MTEEENTRGDKTNANSEIVVRVAGVIIENNKLLLLKGKKHELLWTPGGKRKVGETDEECLRRELKEETGVKLVSLKFIKEHERASFFNPKIRSKQITYLAEIEGEVKPNAEIKSFVWLSREDYNNKKYDTRIEDELISDLIKEKILWAL